MILKILAANAAVVLDRIFLLAEYSQSENIHLMLLSTCAEMCEQFTQPDLILQVEKNLAKCLHFSQACALYYEGGRLVQLDCIRSEKGMSFIREYIILPSQLGLTGACIADRKIVVSSYGRNDPRYCLTSDNVLRVKALDSLMVVPLIAKCNNESKKKEELVGVLHLINYKGDDIKSVKRVFFICD
eukprot:TRINITY_DN11371_c0_g2_i2.p1 TRINITY_DN11371_c0_g2~~TRINITY_DN11371_c0_g2_i2.p1  ORF type:complete len:186 (-),score=31.56 TRINITY_DN11371_c0_g2_i2:359-916(-)